MAQSQHKCIGFHRSYGGNTCGLSFDGTTFFSPVFSLSFLLMRNDFKLLKLNFGFFHSAAVCSLFELKLILCQFLP